MIYTFCRLKSHEKPVRDNLCMTPTQMDIRARSGQPVASSEVSGQLVFDDTDHLDPFDDPRLDIAEVFEMQEIARDGLVQEVNNSIQYLV